MINEIVMALMFATVFILVVSAVIVGSRVSKAKTLPAPEKAEEKPKETPKKQRPLSEELPPAEAEQVPVSTDVFEDEEPRLYAPEPEFYVSEESVEISEPESEARETEMEYPVLEVEPPEPEIEPVPDMDEGEQEAHEPEAVSPEPVLIETPQPEEPIMAEPFEDTYREPDYFRDEEVSPVQGVTICPHCGEKVPATLYCINCGKSLNE
jgi:hypothetical protein